MNRITGFTMKIVLFTLAFVILNALVGPNDALGSTKYSILLSSYFGGDKDEEIISTAFQGNEVLWVTGYTTSNNLGSGNSHTGPKGSRDIFVAKLNISKSKLEFVEVFGGTKDDEPSRIAVNSFGEVYVSGYTQSVDFPVFHARQRKMRGFPAGFLIRFTSNGTLLNSTYHSWSTGEVISELKIGPDDRVIIGGSTFSADYPRIKSLQRYKGLMDGFVTILDRALLRIEFSTLLGGTRADTVSGLDISGHILAVTGVTESDDFPTRNAFQVNKKGQFDAYVMTINTVSYDVGFSTYFGGALEGILSPDTPAVLVLDRRQNIYIAGSATFDFPLKAPLLKDNCDRSDSFVAKFNPVGQPVFSTCFGGSSIDEISDMAISNGALIVVGGTKSTNFPKSNPVQFGLNKGKNRNFLDGFVSVINAGSLNLQFSSFIGGSLDDAVQSVSLNSKGDIAVSGFTESLDFTRKGFIFDPIVGLAGPGEASITILRQTATLQN